MWLYLLVLLCVLMGCISLMGCIPFQKKEPFTSNCATLTALPFNNDASFAPSSPESAGGLSDASESRASATGIRGWETNIPMRNIYPLTDHFYITVPLSRHRANLINNGRQLPYTVKDDAEAVTLSIATTHYVRSVTPVRQLQTLMLNDLDKWMNMISYGHLYFDIGNVTFQDMQQLEVEPSSTIDERQMAVLRTSLNSPRSNGTRHLMVMDNYTHTDNAWAGNAEVGCLNGKCSVWINHTCTECHRDWPALKKVIYHELAHNLGLYHSAGLHGNPEVYNKYGDETCIMGSAPNIIGMCAPQLWHLGFLHARIIQYDALITGTEFDIHAIEFTNRNAAIIVVRGTTRVCISHRSSARNSVLGLPNDDYPVGLHLHYMTTISEITHGVAGVRNYLITYTRTINQEIYISPDPSALRNVTQQQEHFLGVQLLSMNSTTGVARVKINKYGHRT